MGFVMVPTDLIDALEAAGVPIVSVSTDPTGVNGLRIEYDPSASQTQIGVGNSILASFDPTQPSKRQQSINSAKTSAQALNGTALDSLNANQVRTLTKLLAAYAGWVDENGNLNIP